MEQNTPGGFVPSDPKTGLAEVVRVIRERRALRKDLIAKGIKSRKEFRIIAKSMGLELGNNIPLIFGLRQAASALGAGFGLKTVLGGSAALLTGLFLMSTVTEQKGSFTINLTAEMLRAGFVLYDNVSFDVTQTRLFSEKLEQVNNITLTDIPLDVNETDGPHNGKDYIAYTFYVRNEGDGPADYAWFLNCLSETMEVGQCVWIMFFEDGNQVIYAEQTPEGMPEELYGFRTAPFGDMAYAYDYQYYEEDGKYGIVTTPYVDETVVAQGLIQNVMPGEAHKYTIVIWIEGHDPECTDERFGGHAKYSIDFDNVSAEEDDHIFSGLYRTEYKNYGLNPESLETAQTEPAEP